MTDKSAGADAADQNTKMSRRCVCTSAPKVLLALVLIFIAVELFALWSMVINHFPSYQLFRHVDAETLNSGDALTQFGFDRGYRDRFSTQLAQLGMPPIENYSIEEAEAIRVALLDLGRPSGSRLKGDPIRLLTGLRSDATLYCNELAVLYGYSLHTLGFEVRLMHFSRSIFDPWDAHATVEVWDETRGKWIVSDPTFNVAFLLNEEYLSLVEIYRSVHTRETGPIRVKRGEKTTYQYDFDAYYVDYFSLLDNVFYVSHHHLPGPFRYPPLRLADSRRFVGLVSTSDHPVRSGELYIQNFIVSWVFGIGPLLIGLIVISLYRCCRDARSAQEAGSRSSTWGS